MNLNSSICLRMALKWLLASLVLAVCSFALADNCGGPDDCKAVPPNVDGATGVAAGAAVVAVGTAAAASFRRRPEDDEAEETEGAAGTEETVTTGTTGSLEDIFGTPEETGGAGTGEETTGEGEGTIRRGPPDIPLGEDPPPRTPDGN